MCFFVQAEDGIRDLVRSRGLGDVYKRQQNRVMLGERARHVLISLRPVVPPVGNRAAVVC